MNFQFFFVILQKNLNEVMYLATDNPKVSVIVPNYNYSRYLKRRLDSILSQTYQNFELIILDDCSTDDSRAIIKNYQDSQHVSRIIFNDKNSGSPFLQWEKGIRYAQGEWIWIAESDDAASEQFLSTLLNEASNSPKAILAFSHSYFIDDKDYDLHIDWHNNTDGLTRVYEGESFARKKMLWSCYVYNASMAIFRKEAFNNITDSYKKYHSKGDWAFWMSICLQGQVIEVCKPLNYFRQHSQKVTEVSNKDGSDWKECAQVLRGFKNQIHMNYLQRTHFRGHWTFDLLQSRNNHKTELMKEYPDVFGGKSWERFYSRIIEKIKKLTSNN